MCEAGVTNAEPSEDNSISAVKVGEIALAKRGLDRMQLGLVIERLMVRLPAGALSSQLGQLSFPSLRGK